MTTQPELYEDRKIREALERGDTAKADFWRRVKADVDQAPPLSPEQIAKLRVLIAPDLARYRAKHDAA
ncbi:hypothetical protein [Streptomyces noursei]|uniref:hypothetical protein n=1 Tax=Streptomyces noursei TaxID=1971 RepID=UPI0035E2D8D1